MYSYVLSAFDLAPRRQEVRSVCVSTLNTGTESEVSGQLNAPSVLFAKKKPSVPTGLKCGGDPTSAAGGGGSNP